MCLSVNKVDINIQDVFEKMLGNQQLVMFVLKEFRTQLEQDLDIILNGIHQEDFDLLFEKSHALKGSAAIAGAELVHETLREMQIESEKKNLPGTLALFEELRTRSSAFIRCASEIEELS